MSEDNKWLERVRSQPLGHKITEYKDLPAWVRSALTMMDVLGLSKEETAKRCGKSVRSIERYTPAPAAKAWREELREVSESPRAMAELMLKANTLNVTTEYFAAYEKAVEAGDYAQVAKISQDLMDRQGLTKKKEKPQQEKLHVTLNLGGASALDIPEISATYEEVEAVDTDYEVVEDV